MTRSPFKSGVALAILCCTIAACGGTSAPAKADPNAPAVVKAPPPVLASDTAKPVIPPVIADDEAQQTLLRSYSLLAAALANDDARMAMSLYAPTAEFTTVDGTFKGKPEIAKAYGAFAAGHKLQDFQRSPRAIHVINADSTVVDSGSYKIVLKRAGAPVERGTYATVWRIHPPPLNWVMLKDHLMREGAKKAK